MSVPGEEVYLNRTLASEVFDIAPSSPRHLEDNRTPTPCTSVPGDEGCLNRTLASEVSNTAPFSPRRLEDNHTLTPCTSIPGKEVWLNRTLALDVSETAPSSPRHLEDNGTPTPSCIGKFAASPGLVLDTLIPTKKAVAVARQAEALQLLDYNIEHAAANYTAHFGSNTEDMEPSVDAFMNKASRLVEGKREVEEPLKGEEGERGGEGVGWDGRGKGVVDTALHTLFQLIFFRSHLAAAADQPRLRRPPN
jgi:hypothetical protein